MPALNFTELSHKRQQSVIIPDYTRGLKIALITETFAPEINGVAMTLGRLATGLQAEGCAVTVIAPRRPDRCVEDFTYGMVTVPGFPIPGYSDLRFGLPAGHKLRRMWRADPPDWVHVATEGPLGWSAVCAAKSLNLSLVTSYHTNFDSYSQHYNIGLLGKFITRWMRSVHRHALLTWVPSSGVRDRLLQQGYGRIEILGRGVDTQLFGPHRRCSALRASWGCQADTPVAIYVGRLAGEKNLPIAFKAWQTMRTTIPDLKFVVVGDGPLRAEMEKQFPDAIFAGMRVGESLAAHYASADTFLFASETETFGNVVTEAMASGLCVLAYDYAAPGRYIQHGHSGFLVPFGNAELFAETATTLAHARNQWTAIGHQARLAVSNLSWNAITRSYLEHIHQLK